mmetsp:Transcript_13354/g.14968  ORF Transcript_13354/g.14968 Transcript_13354/m.14968 type:complete len:195 (+) Transcript_13354:202-786(+)|eukprot:CAMPEP_0205811998 /NCGR_PEP_ID=MMETSP0205-20121125/16311_1 /ASSEMBLY_ACC=CAM_ASM_000278 /TAXON_ID=36767 /ORGANISM="Euplotes focardii, Strain TN1" /LENGTH=194 /DNA_ID=CAMNT_0053091955 /DNA_START=189 /DNA_END=773 /DNA_ORIENTATION=-
MAMLDNPNTNINNNFDGVLDADSCSLDSFSNDDSSDMDTFSDVDITDHSDNDQISTKGVYDQGCVYYCGNDLPTTSFTTTTITTKIDDESLAHQEINRINIENNIIDEESRGRRGRRDLVEEEEFSFKCSKQEKAKPILPGVGLLQGLDLSSSLSVSQVVEHIVEHDEIEDDCMADAAACGMYQTQGMQAQNSF